MKYTFKLADVKKSVEALLKKYGRSYTYTDHAESGGMECLYEDDTPSGGCIVGCVARDLLSGDAYGVEFQEQDVPQNQPWAQQFSPLSIRFLTDLQNKQDGGAAWGTAYDDALADYANVTVIEA